MLIGREIPEAQPPASPDGKPDRIERKTDWDELADKYGNVHVRVNAGRSDGLTPFILHRIVSDATRLPDHAIGDIVVHRHEAGFAVPKDAALSARTGLQRTKIGGYQLDAEFESRETTVRTA